MTTSAASGGGFRMPGKPNQAVDDPQPAKLLSPAPENDDPGGIHVHCLFSHPLIVSMASAGSADSGWQANVSQSVSREQYTASLSLNERSLARMY
ncbi:hypothetical protein TYRP_015006 [Tyrophagus putrescentiae]|nr:hypothetical protein TYRP_015006 [Tyrophagus putrescentiae]